MTENQKTNEGEDNLIAESLENGLKLKYAKENTNSTNLVENKPKGKHLFQKGHKKMGGKKKGTKNGETIKKELAEQEFKNRILANIYELLSAQMKIAKGTSYLFKIVETKKGGKEHILVDDPLKIKYVLDEVEGEGQLDNNYYYISTKQPDNRALDSLIDRVFGKAKETIDLNAKVLNINQLLDDLNTGEFPKIEE